MAKQQNCIGIMVMDPASDAHQVNPQLFTLKHVTGPLIHHCQMVKRYVGQKILSPPLEVVEINLDQVGVPF